VAARSISRTSSRNFSSLSTGGRKTCTKPSRAWKTNAVRVGASFGSTTTACSGSACSVSAGPALTYDSSPAYSGSVQERASSGNRDPAGDSPGTSTRRPRRVLQAGLAQPSPNQDGIRGRTQAAGPFSVRSSSLTKWESGRSGSSAGLGPVGWLTSRASPASGAFNAGRTLLSGHPPVLVLAP